MTTQSNTSNDTIQNTTYTVTLEEGEDDECILPLPDEVLDALDWQDGDMLEWIVNEEDNTILLKKVAA